nr:J205 [uncultured bacterium]
MPKLFPPFLASLMAAGLLAATAVLSPVRTVDALTNCTVADLSVDSEESAFLTLVNNYRATKGAEALTMSANLNRAATWHATDMATKAYFSHTDSLGRSSNTRMMQCDVKPGGTGENIAAGTNWDTAQEAFNAWVNSSGHEANMRNANYRQIGISRVYLASAPYRWYWVTDFSTVNDGTSPGGGGGGTATATPVPPTPTPTPPATVNTKAAMQTPAPGSQLAGDTVTFSWNAGSGAREYFIYVGTRAGSNNIYGGSTGQNLSATVDDIPTDGRTIYVRLWTRFSSGWQSTDYTYRAAP